VAQYGHRARVVFGLEQARHELQLISPDQGRRLLQPDIGLEPVRQHVVIPGPPARAVGALGQPQQVPALADIGHAVEGEQVGDVPLLEADPAMLESADLGTGSPDLVTGIFRRDAGRLTQLTELATKQHAEHRRPARRLGNAQLVLGLIAGLLNHAHDRSRGMTRSTSRPATPFSLLRFG
jgi:hypothetical protein